MYTVDEHDSVHELTDVPQSSVGAPCPMLLADEHGLRLAYYVETDDSEDGLCALVRFEGINAHLFGPPGDENFHAHPLAARGLKRYAVSEVRNSSWIRALERMNSVHPKHSPERFTSYRHFVFAFHDSTLECIATDFRVEVVSGTVNSVLLDTTSGSS